MICRIFHGLKMRVSESSFESYKSTRILFFANFICSSVSGLKALKKGVCDFLISDQNIFSPRAIFVRSLHIFLILFQQDAKILALRNNITRKATKALDLFFVQFSMLIVIIISTREVCLSL